MSNLSPEHDDSDEIIRKNLVKNIAKDLVNSKMSNGERVHVKKSDPKDGASSITTYTLVSSTSNVNIDETSILSTPSSNEFDSIDLNIAPSVSFANIILQGLKNIY